MKDLADYVSRIRSFSPDARRYLVTTALLGVGTAIQWLFFNLYVLALGYDQAFVGLLAGLPALVTALAALPIGIFLPRIGYRRGLLSSGLIYAVAFLGWALFPVAGVLVVGSLLVGLASAFILVSSAPLMMTIGSEDHRTELFGVQFGLSTLVGVLANLAGGHLPRAFAGLFGVPSEDPLAYRSVLLVAAALAASALFAIARMRTARGIRKYPLIRLRELAVHRSTFARLLSVQLTVALGAGMLMPFVNVYYKLRFDLPDPLIGTVFSLSSLMTGLSALVAPLLVTRVGKLRTIVYTQALSLPFLFAMGFAPWLGLSIAGFLLRTALMNMSAPVFSAFSMGLVPTHLRPLTASLMALAWNAGWAASSTVSGRIQVTIGFWPLFVITGTFYVTVVLLTYILFRSREQEGGAALVEQLHVDEEERV